jgi:hypothetical protein
MIGSNNPNDPNVEPIRFMATSDIGRPNVTPESCVDQMISNEIE